MNAISRPPPNRATNIRRLQSPKICKTELNSCNGGAVVSFYRGHGLGPDQISERARAAIGVLSDEFKAVSHDPRLTEALWRAVAPLGRPSGSSPPADEASALKLPLSPPAWWRDRKPGETADNWLRTHYKPYIDAGLLTRSFFQRKGQDKAFYNALLAWEHENQLPADLRLPTKSELVDRQIEEMGGITKAASHPYVSTPEARQASRLYQAARRRLG